MFGLIPKNKWQWLRALTIPLQLYVVVMSICLPYCFFKWRTHDFNELLNLNSPEIFLFGALLFGVGAYQLDARRKTGYLNIALGILAIVWVVFPRMNEL
jgi:hypothetical protein